MIPSPIRKVLSIFQKCEVRALLMGGQACVLYGVAQFSRDTDFAILADERNLIRLADAIKELRGEVIAVPPFTAENLLRGHAIHFRCYHPEAERMRVDVMARMRGVAPFPELWERRTTLEDESGTRYEVLGLEDLVVAKKTQRDRDWPMIRRLAEAHYLENRENPNTEQVRFWFRELRTPEILHAIAERFPDLCAECASVRPLLRPPLEVEKLDKMLAEEERLERAVDREYWDPLRKELEEMRRAISRALPGEGH